MKNPRNSSIHPIYEIDWKTVSSTSVLASLTAREERVFRMLHGIGMGNKLSHEEVAKQFHLSVDKIRQYEALAYRKLQHPRRWEMIKKSLNK